MFTIFWDRLAVPKYNERVKINIEYKYTLYFGTEW